MMGEQAPTEQQIEAAILWQLLLNDASLSPARQAEFDAWLRQDPCHQIAWQRIHDIHASASTPLAQAILQEVAALHQQNVFTSAKQFVSTHATKHKGLLTLLCVMGLSYGYLNQQQWPAWALADYRSTTLEVKTLVLADGSKLTLAGNTAVDVRFSHGQRTIILRKGTVFADVAKDPNRPFIISSQQGSATALGTEFSVQQTSKQRVTVTVVSSTVKACASSTMPEADEQCQNVMANQAITMTPQGLSSVSPIDALADTAWRDQLLMADNMRLSDLLTRLAEHNKGLIYFNEQTFSQHRISGVFPLNNADEAFAAIQKVYPLTVKRYTPYLTTLSIKNN